MMDSKNPAVNPEPAPKRTDSPAVWPLVIADMENIIPDAPPWLRILLHADMWGRHAMGLSKYGVPLQVENGRDAATDAYQEALDLSAYSRQMAERTGLGAWRIIHEESVKLAASILYQMGLEKAEERYQMHSREIGAIDRRMA